MLVQCYCQLTLIACLNSMRFVIHVIRLIKETGAGRLISANWASQVAVTSKINSKITCMTCLNKQSGGVSQQIYIPKSIAFSGHNGHIFFGGRQTT